MAVKLLHMIKYHGIKTSVKPLNHVVPEKTVTKTFMTQDDVGERKMTDGSKVIPICRSSNTLPAT